MKTYRVDFEPIGRRAEVEAGKTLLDAARLAGVELVALCGGIGVCGGCRVRLAKGTLSQPTQNEVDSLDEEDLANGYRLACQAVPQSDVKIDIPPESLTMAQRLQVEGKDIEIQLDEIVKPINLQPPIPDLDDLRADTTRLKTVAAGKGIDSLEFEIPVLGELSNQLRAQDWKVRLALRGNRVVGAVTLEEPLLGLAVDIGTTKVAGYLIDLGTGETLAKTGVMNPQIGYGEDVVSRISYCNEHTGGRKLLQQKLVDVLNRMVEDLCTRTGARREQVVEAVLVGNTVMHHLFAGLPVRQLGSSPYVPAVAEAMDFLAREVGLHLSPGAHIYLPPNIAGFVGADHVSMVLASEIWNTDQTVIALDIGTNTEITLARSGKILCCSCASGPAFEGAHIKDGMRAAPGAIEKIQFIGGEFQYQTIVQRPPVGICGSGILDAAATLLDAGVLDSIGRLRKDAPSVRGEGGKAEFVLVPAEDTGHGRDIVVTRKDINEIQLAKGAIRAGIEILLDEAGLTAEDLDRIIVAGAFGTYLDVRSAIRIGMLPDISLDRFSQIGNAAGMGAKQMLVSAARRREASRIAQREQYIELSTHQRFSKIYMKCLSF